MEYITLADKMITLCKNAYEKDYADCQNQDCDSCLNEYHYTKARSSYHCKNVCFHYVGKYATRFTLEMTLALKAIPLPKNGILRTLSLGCGPATELCALDSLHAEKRINGYTYTGVDYNSNWEQVQNFYQEHNYRNVSIQFALVNALDFIDNCDVRQYDLIVFNYFLSDMVKYVGINEVKTLLNKLSIKMLKANHYPSIIYNDAVDGYSVNFMQSIFANNSRFQKVKRYFSKDGQSRQNLESKGFIMHDRQYSIRSNQKGGCTSLGSTQMILTPQSLQEVA